MRTIHILLLAITGISFLNMVCFYKIISNFEGFKLPYLEERPQLRLTIPIDTSFKHNFCESKLQNNQGPEYWNAITSSIISIVPFVFGFPQYPLLYNVACMLAVNGIASCHYHYNLTWSGKQGDEISMILANYFGLWGLINMYYKKSDKRNNKNRYNTAFMYLFLVSNTLIEYDPLFPSIFGIYVGGSLLMIYKVAIKYQIPYKTNLTISFIGASAWIISEHWCNEFTKFGHPLWHLLFPLGFYRLILDYDKVKTDIPKIDISI